MQMRGGEPANPYIRVGDPVALQPGGLGGRPPRCRATGPQGPARNFLREIFFRNAPAAPLPGGRVYSCKFPNQKYIFVKNENKKYKNKKTARVRTQCQVSRFVPFLSQKNCMESPNSGRTVEAVDYLMAKEEADLERDLKKEI